MNILNKLSVTVGAVLLSGAVFAQDPLMNDQAQQGDLNTGEVVNEDWKPALVKDGVIDKVPHVNKALELYNIREVDAAWKRRVWQEIDIRQKQNSPFIYQGDEFTGGGAFIEILIDAVKKGKIAAFNGFDDRFSTPLDLEAFETSIGGTEDSSLSIDPITLEETWVKTRTEFNVHSVTKYRVKEDWIFDRNAGRMVVRIIGIAPLKDILNNDGSLRGVTPMFWLYYPDLRNILANYEVYNGHNDLHRMSWTDYLDGRYFASYPIKNSANNPSGTNYTRDLRGLEQANRDMEVIMNKEMDMWQK